MTGGNWPEVPSALGGAAAGAVAAPIPYLKQDFEDGSLDLGNWDYWRNRVAPAAVIGAGYGGLSGLIGSGYKPVMPPKWQTNSLIGAPRVSRMPPGPSGLALLPAAGYSQPYQDQNGDWRFANPPTWPWR
jgi:hypothetical protein